MDPIIIKFKMLRARLNGGGESAWQDKRTGLLISFTDNKKVKSEGIYRQNFQLCSHTCDHYKGSAVDDYFAMIMQ